MKLDFIAGLLHKAARATGVEAFRGVQAQIGEVIGWRNLFWSLTDAMACNPEPWVDGAVLPNRRASSTYRMFMTEAYPAVRAIVEKVVASGLIYLPSNVRDFKNPDIDKYLARYVRGSNGIDYKERIKTMKLLWDAIGSEFGARHELYEMNYAGSHELVRLFPLQQAQASGALGKWRRSPSAAWRITTRTAGGTPPIATAPTSRFWARVRRRGPVRLRIGLAWRFGKSSTADPTLGTYIGGKSLFHPNPPVPPPPLPPPPLLPPRGASRHRHPTRPATPCHDGVGAFPHESPSAAALNLHAGKIRLGVFRDLDRVDVGEDIGGNVVWHVMRQRSERLDLVGALDRDA